MSISITLGTLTYFANHANNNGIVGAESCGIAYDSVNQKVLIVYKEFPDSGSQWDFWAVVGTVSGTGAISLGTPVQFDYYNSSVREAVAVCYEPTSGKFIVSVGTAYFYVVSISGTVPTIGARNTLSYTDGSEPTMVPVDDKVVIFYKSSGYDPACVVLSISGDTITGGTPLVVSTDNIEAYQRPRGVYNSTHSLLFMIHNSVSGVGNDLTISTISLSGTTLTLDDQDVINVSGHAEFPNIGYNSTTGDCIAMYYDDTNGGCYAFDVSYSGGAIVSDTPAEAFSITSTDVGNIYRSSPLVYDPITRSFSSIQSNTSNVAYIASISSNASVLDGSLYEVSTVDSFRVALTYDLANQVMVGVTVGDDYNDLGTLFPFVAGSPYVSIFWTNFKDQTETTS